MNHRIAFTDPLTGQTQYTEEATDNYSAQLHHLEVSCDQSQLIADGESHIILNFELLTRLNYPVKHNRICVIRVHNKIYKIQLDENGQAAVPLQAKNTGHITVEALDPPGGIFFIDAIDTPHNLDNLDEMSLHDGPILFEG